MFKLSTWMLATILWCCCWGAQATPVRTVEIQSQHDCFAGRSYDQWMDYLWEKNNILTYLMIRLKFPENEYERFRKGLDCRSITYQSDQHVVFGWLVTPKHRPPGGKLPVIIYNRGGNRSFGALTFAHLFAHVFPLAEQGYMVVASQYRGATTPQDAPSSPDQFGGDDVRDVTNLVRLVAGLRAADTKNLFMIGQSRGAVMTFRALLETPIPIRAVAIYSGVYDVRDLIKMRPAFDELFELMIPDYRQNRSAELDRRSVTRWPGRLPPATGVLMFHGDEDERAPVASARKLASQLDRLERPNRIVIYPGESHFLDGVRSDVREQTLAWFRRFQWRPVADERATSKPRPVH